MKNTIFSSENTLRDGFCETIIRSLEKPSPGSVVLAIAQHLHDVDISTRIAKATKTAFGKILQILDQDGGPKDDLHILRRVKDLGLENLFSTEYKRMNGFLVQLNQFRSLRPKRAAAEKPTSIYQPVDFSTAFHFDVARIKCERVWRGTICSRDSSLFVNKFPFARLHALLVLEQSRHHIQFLFPDHHLWIWNVLEELGLAIPGVCAGYNSFGAFPSVPQLHWQFAVEPEGLPIMDAHWQQNVASDKYPLPFEVFTCPEDSWQWIEDRIRGNEPYNLLYLPGKVICFVRRFQNSYEQAHWTSGFAWYECAGAIITSERADYEALTTKMIVQEFAAMKMR